MHERVALTQLPRRERREQDGRRRKDADRPRGVPAPGLPLRDREDEYDEATRDENRPADVVAVAERVAALLEQDRREREGGEADRHVDEEDPLPGEEIG